MGGGATLSQAARADGNSWCATAFLESDGTRTVLIQGLEGEPGAPSDAKITSIEDATADCTRVDFVPAGLVAINLRGPAA